MGAYLFVHFIGTERTDMEEQIYFSVSKDGSEWKTLNGGKPVLISNLGEKGVRDPFILRGEDGKFFIIATDLSIYHRSDNPQSWVDCQRNGSRSIIVWESDDIVNWSDARMVEVAAKDAGCTWAPESIYDPEKGMYMVYWASQAAFDGYAKERVYRAYTKDFKTFTEAEIYIDEPQSAIDTCILKHGDTYYRFTKDETHKAVTMMKSKSLSTGWEDVTTYTINGVAGNTVFGFEGPTIFKYHGEDKWCLLLDNYAKRAGYKPFITTDLDKGEFTSPDDFNFDAIYRHGTVTPIKDEEYNALVEKYGF
ncbi:MAG: glycoside hydrolase family 43 protein [Clostridia bacterium]|nr:glycoside hydrolase family 43 protein [Clostridia bacterium]